MAEQTFRGHSEVTRYVVTTLIALASAFILPFVLPDDFYQQTHVIVLITVYLLYWIVYVVVFGAWTVYTLSRLDPSELRAYAIAERAAAQRKWVKMLAIKGAANLSILGAIVAMAAAILMTRIDIFREDWRWLVVGGVTVALSWVFMIVAYAAGYLELDYTRRAEDDKPLLEFDYLEEEPRYVDYLNVAVMVSTMSASLPATPRGRAAWKEIRYNTLIAFTFNTMIIAMVISVLSTSLSS